MIGRTMLVVGALALCCSGPRAAAPGCERYFQHGIEPGMSNRDVWQVMGRRGVPEGVVHDESGTRTVERYDEGPGIIRVRYDGNVSKKSSAKVVAIEITFEEALVEVPGLLSDLRGRLGPPSSGGDHLAQGLETGPVEWSDAACGVEVRLFRRPPSWWDPSASAEFHVKIVGIPTADAPAEPAPPRAAATGPPSEPPAVSPAVARDRSETEARPAVASEPAPRRGSAVADEGPEVVVPPVMKGDASPPPRMPAAARAHAAEGQVVLRVVVHVDGSVGDVRVEHADPPGLGLEQAAMRAVKKWSYEPATRDGRPVEAEILVTFNFR